MGYYIAKGMGHSAPPSRELYEWATKSQRGWGILRRRLVSFMVGYQIAKGMGHSAPPSRELYRKKMQRGWRHSVPPSREHSRRKQTKEMGGPRNLITAVDKYFVYVVALHQE
jgi:hypothetical protein